MANPNINHSVDKLSPKLIRSLFGKLPDPANIGRSINRILDFHDVV